MTTHNRCLRIAILNDGDDTISMLVEWFKLHGHAPLSAKLVDMRKEHISPEAFVMALGVDVVIFDIGVPYAVNWYYAELLRIKAPGQIMVVTTSNHQALTNIVGENHAFEITGTNPNLTALLAAVITAAPAA